LIEQHKTVLDVGAEPLDCEYSIDNKGIEVNDGVTVKSGRDVKKGRTIKSHTRQISITDYAKLGDPKK
jgi:hypothetical protein